MWPRLGKSRFVTNWLVATLAISILAVLEGGSIFQWLALVPSRAERVAAPVVGPPGINVSSAARP